jgi:NAD(P)H-hydrate repair Nnr-like enzyme with NAD(P)H-hydrate epimerase domain
MARERVPDDVWQPQALIDMMLAESVVEPEVSPEEKARRILTKAAPIAAHSVAFLAKYASAEQVRLAASKYIIDGVVGGGFKSNSAEDDTLIALIKRLSDNDERQELGIPNT